MQLFRGGFGQFGQIEARPFGLGLTGVKPREREQLLHNFAQMHDFFQQAGRPFAHLLIETRVFCKVFQFTAQDCERRAQVMRGVGDKPF